MDGVADAIVDTTARAVIRMKKADAKPDLDAINEALGKSMSTKSIDKTEQAKASEVYTVNVKGLG